MLTIVMSTAWGAILGRASAWLAWMAIYSVGSRVVADEEHYDLAGIVYLTGTVIGAVLGLGVGVFARWPLLALLGVHFVTGMVFAMHTMIGECYGILAMHSWRTGLATHWGLLIVAAAAFARVLWRGKKERPTTPPTVFSSRADAV